MELERLAIEMFSDIKNKETDDANNNIIENHVSTFSSIFKKEVLKSTILMRPIKDVRDISIIWQLPDDHSLYSNDPSLLIGSCIFV